MWHCLNGLDCVDGSRDILAYLADEQTLLASRFYDCSLLLDTVHVASCWELGNYVLPSNPCKLAHSPASIASPKLARKVVICSGHMPCQLCTKNNPDLSELDPTCTSHTLLTFTDTRSHRQYIAGVATDFQRCCHRRLLRKTKGAGPQQEVLTVLPRFGQGTKAWSGASAQTIQPGGTGWGVAQWPWTNRRPKP